MKLSDLEKAITYSWYEDTSADSENWNEENQSYGQCAVTALVVQDYLGGKIVNAQAQLPKGRILPNGKDNESHYFNNINGTEIDLTRDQFPIGTVVPWGKPKTGDFETTREYVLSYESTKQRYELIKERVKNLVIVNRCVREAGYK